jgi:flagellar hook-basal body complex protein FliE
MVQNNLQQQVDRENVMSDFTIKPISISQSNLNGISQIDNSVGKTNNNDFSKTVTDALDTVAEMQSESGKIKSQFEMGEENDLAKVMLKSQVSGLAFDLALNVRNKVLSAYKDIMSMPV